MKRYAIVRVDGHCPNRFENIQNDWVCKVDKNMNCKHRCSKNRYGDTKEQLMKKVAQVLFRKEMKWWKEHLTLTPNRKIDEPFIRSIYEQCLEKAKEIISFLGVEDDKRRNK